MDLATGTLDTGNWTDREPKSAAARHSDNLPATQPNDRNDCVWDPKSASVTRLTPIIPPPKQNSVQCRQAHKIAGRKIFVTVIMGALFGIGTFLRVFPSAGFERVGFDEHGYMVFVKQIQTAGFWNYDAVVKLYVERQSKQPDAVVPATRATFLAPAALVGEVFHLDAFHALRTTAATAGVLMLLLSAFFAYRLGGTIPMLGVTALVATAPLQIYLSQRALIDGYFAFWAVAVLWLAWENLQRPRHWGWLGAYTICLTILVLTKENAAFVVFAIFGVLLLNQFLRMGTVTPHLLLATIIGPTIAVLVLAAMVGGAWEWVQFNRMFVAKSRANFYSIMAQDGPWYRYVVDFVIISPLLAAFACGRIFQTRKADQAGIFMAAFLLLSVAAMSAVKYGMSLRYAAFCDIPLCWLACSQAIALSKRSSKCHPAIVASALLLILSAVGVNQYVRFFVKGGVYDPTTAALVWSSGMEKAAPETARNARAQAKNLPLTP
jgi:hypothetical protein